ncbi:MAG: monovalent cation/H(+) antiporter subunit G [Candidatus Geothermincolia bacterium]
MVGLISDILVVAFAVLGVIFFLGGTIGLVRCPDLYSRLHPATKCDTMGACSIALALTLDAGWDIAVLKLILVIFLLLITSAPSGHSIGRSAFVRGIKPVGRQGA